MAVDSTKSDGPGSAAPPATPEDSKPTPSSDEKFEEEYNNAWQEYADSLPDKAPIADKGK